MEITGKKQKLRKNAFILFFLLPTLVCFCVFYLYPIATVVISSFAKWDYTNLNDMQMYSFGHLFDNYKYIFEKYPYFWEGLRNSCIWALCGLVIQVPIATGVALVISKKCRGSAFNEEIATQITGNREMKHTRIITTYETIFPKVPTPWTASFSLPFLCLLIIFCLLSVFSHETAC